MNKSKKIVLFIVEGTTDETSLGLILSKIIERDKIVKFKVIRGDITTKNGVNTDNIIDNISNQVKNFLSTDIYNKSDIFSIIHLVDMDGAYVDDSCIAQKDVSKTRYSTEKIYTDNIDALKSRNKQKSQLLDYLLATKEIYSSIPYKLYFFSCNLEHVLHNDLSLEDSKKVECAYNFEDKYIDAPDKFVEFMNSSDFAISGDYSFSWDFIRKDNNSLKRYSNFHIFLNDYSYIKG